MEVRRAPSGRRPSRPGAALTGHRGEDFRPAGASANACPRPVARSVITWTTKGVLVFRHPETTFIGGCRSITGPGASSVAHFWDRAVVACSDLRHFSNR
jgi:hypothetical protein